VGYQFIHRQYSKVDSHLMLRVALLLTGKSWLVATSAQWSDSLDELSLSFVPSELDCAVVMAHFLFLEVVVAVLVEVVAVEVAVEVAVAVVAVVLVERTVASGVTTDTERSAACGAVTGLP